MCSSDLSDSWNWFDRDVVTWQAHVGLSPELLDDLQELRLVVEPAAVALACSRATPADTQALEEAYKGMKAAVETTSLDDYIFHDEAFHTGLLHASHNRMFVQMGRALSILLREGLAIASRTPNQGIVRSLPLHHDVVQAILARDAHKAFNCSRRLIEHARIDMRQVLGVQ